MFGYIHLPLSCVYVCMLSGCQTLSIATEGLGTRVHVSEGKCSFQSHDAYTTQSVNATTLVNAKLWHTVL